MHKDETRMFHSLISFALNTKMLSPREVVSAVEKSYLSNQLSINAAEGFIRQIIGWREYIRGYYWAHMPALVIRIILTINCQCLIGFGMAKPK